MGVKHMANRFYPSYPDSDGNPYRVESSSIWRFSTCNEYVIKQTSRWVLS